MSHRSKMFVWMERRRAEKSLQRQRESLTATHLHESKVSGIRLGGNGDNMAGRKNLLIESSPVVLSLVEGRNDGKVIARGEFGRVGVPTDNGRIYPQKLMEREISRLSKDLKSRRVLGELDHPSDGKTSLKRVSHVITSLKINSDGIVEGEAEILNTPEGKTLKAIIEAKVQVGVSSRGFGSTAPSSGPHEGEEVQEDFILKTYDFVADPAMKSAVPGIYTEDIDDPTLAKMFLDEFPDVAASIRGGDGGSELTEADGKKSKNSDAEKEVVDRLSENFERKLKDALLAQRDEISAELREGYERDPEVAGAKGILSAIAEMVGAYVATPDEEIVRDAMKAKDLEVAEALAREEKATEVAKKATFALHIERKIGTHPMAGSIRKVMKGRDFESIKSVDEAIKAVIADLPDADDLVTKEEAQTRVENAELRGQITLLEGKVDELNARVRKAGVMGQRIDEQRIHEVEEAKSVIEDLEKQLAEARADAVAASSEAEHAVSESREELEREKLKVYKLEKVAGLPNGRKLLGLMEQVQDRRVVDELVRKQGVQKMQDPMLDKMRNSRKGLISPNDSVLNEEDLLESSPNPSDVAELGYDMDEMSILSGINVD